MKKMILFPTIMMMLGLTYLATPNWAKADSDIITNSMQNHYPMATFNTNQVPKEVTNYWLSWRQVQTTQSIQIQQINYVNKSTLKKNFGPIKELPKGTTIYIKGWQLETDDPQNMYFMVANSLSDPIASQYPNVTQPFWAMNIKNLSNLELTKNNDVINPINVKQANVQNLDNQFRRVYLDPSTENNELPVFSTSYKDAKKHARMEAQADIDSDSEDNHAYHLATQYLNKSRKQSPKLKSVEQPIYERFYKNKIYQVKLNNRIYYTDDKLNLYNTPIDPVNEINSLQKPTSIGISDIVLPNGSNLYAFKSEYWDTLKIKNGKLSSYQFIYDGTQWQKDK